MARPRATDDERRAQRDRIRAAAAAVHREHGLPGVTVRAVAAEAGVSPGLIYRHFENLHDLLRSLWAEPVAEVGAALEAMAAGIDDPVERIRALLHSYVRFAAERPEVFRGAVLWVRPHDAAAPDVQPADDLPFHRLLHDAVAEAAAAGRLAVDDESAELAQMLWAGVHGAVSLPIHVDIFDVAPAEHLATSIIEHLLAAIVATTAPSG